MRAMISLIITIALSSLCAAQSAHKASNCRLEVNGKVYFSGACDFSSEKDGSFQISKKGSPYFAQVDLHDKDDVSAFWNAQPSATHAQTYLGSVKRQGGCWANEQVRICASK